MSKQEAISELSMLSDGTLANLTGLRNYNEIDAVLGSYIEAIENDHVDVSECETWLDVWNKCE